MHYRCIQPMFYYCYFLTAIILLVAAPSAAADTSNSDGNENTKQNDNNNGQHREQQQQQQQEQHTLTFGAIPGNTPFFEPFETGWNDACNKLGINCLYKIPKQQQYQQSNNTNNATTNNNSSSSLSSLSSSSLSCYDIINEYIQLNVDGIAIKPCNDDGNDNNNNTEVIKLLDNSGIPYVTFDKDLNNSTRFSYIGTDNEFMGRTMARLLKQLRPLGGTFVIIAGNKDDRDIGFRKEIFKDNHRDDRPHWYEIIIQDDDDPINNILPYDNNENDIESSSDGDHGPLRYAKQIQDYTTLHKNNITAIIVMRQTPMRFHNWTNLVEEYIHSRNITIIGTDGADYQLNYLTRKYVHGLIGQLPYDMGKFAVQTLYDKIINDNNVNDGKVVIPDIIKTNLVSYNLIPIELPKLVVDQHLLNGLSYIGFTCYGIIAFCSLLCIVWTIINRNGVVVKASQPFFLIMTAIGILIMSSALVPLSFDDNGDPLSMTTTTSIAICMSIPWLCFVGFTLTFSALFSKTWRINQMLGAGHDCIRTKVLPRDGLWPCCILLTSNFIILICWTIIDPLTYERRFTIGTDFWNREFESYGSCKSNHSVAYLIPLGVVNLSVLLIACWQAIVARGIETEFSEANYIGLSVFSLCQAFLTGIPIVAVVRDIPEAFYLVLTFLIFLLCSVILLLIFLPKMILQRKYAGMTQREQKDLLALKVRQSMSKSRISGATTAASNNPSYQQSDIHTQQSYNMYYDPSRQNYHHHHQEPHHTVPIQYANGVNNKNSSAGSGCGTIGGTGPKQVPISQGMPDEKERPHDVLSMDLGGFVATNPNVT